MHRSKIYDPRWFIELSVRSRRDEFLILFVSYVDLSLAPRNLVDSRNLRRRSNRVKNHRLARRTFNDAVLFSVFREFRAHRDRGRLDAS